MKKKLPRLVPAGIPQLVVALIDNLQEHLGRPVRGTGYVHRIRVDIKRLRAWIRLIRDEEDVVGLRGIDRELRDITKKLSLHRDQQALRDSLKWLEKKADEDNKRSSLSVARSRIETGKGRIPIDWEHTKTELLHTLATLSQHTRKVNSIHMVRDGLQRTYKRAAKAGDQAFSGKINPEDVHEFRKWAKYLFYQLEIIRAAYPELYQEALENLEDLGNRLGRYHDLILVKERIKQVPATRKYADAMKRMDIMIEERMHKLLRRGNRLYRKVFSESSSRFVKDLA